MRHLKIKINKQTKNLQRVIYFSHHWNVESRAGIFLFVRESIWFSATAVIRLLRILIYLLHKIRIFYFDFENAFTGYIFWAVHHKLAMQMIFSRSSRTHPNNCSCLVLLTVEGTCVGSFGSSGGFSSTLEDDCLTWWPIPKSQNESVFHVNH